MGEDVNEVPEEPDDEFFASCSQEENDEWLRHITHLIAQLSPETKDLIGAVVARAYQQDKRKGKLDIRNAARVKMYFEAYVPPGAISAGVSNQDEILNTGPPPDESG